MFRIFVIFGILTMAVYGNINLYMTYSDGYYEVEENIDSKSLGNGVFGWGLEYEKRLYEQMSFLGGFFSQNDFSLKENNESYNFAVFFVGMRVYYFEQNINNFYIVGRYGYPNFYKKNEIDFEINGRSGWGELGIGILHKDRFYTELLYEQHGAQIKNYDESYMVKLLSLKFAYSFF